ncbi:MAG: hypothetical protein QNJ65_21270 [Xenococcaceae cyanobacterium MO_234.B1]|nr:hypothetical protein [Xenococcaceae cyanobacterium MO_234.B1]
MAYAQSLPDCCLRVTDISTIYLRIRTLIFFSVFLPEMIALGKKTLLSLDRTYNIAYLGETLMTYWETYIALNKNPNEFNALLQDYKNRIENRSLPESYYYNLAWNEARDKFVFLQELANSGKDSNIVAPAVYFWLRRYLDDTHEQIFPILELLLKSYSVIDRQHIYINPETLPEL